MLSHGTENGKIAGMSARDLFAFRVLMIPATQIPLLSGEHFHLCGIGLQSSYTFKAKPKFLQKPG